MTSSYRKPDERRPVRLGGVADLEATGHEAVRRLDQARERRRHDATGGFITRRPAVEGGA
jgi:hypothetical protein